MDSGVKNLSFVNNLSNYWDDSLKVNRERLLLFFNPISKPILFQEKFFEPTIKNVKDYLSANGYFHSQVEDSFKKVNYKKQIRIYTFLKIHLGNKLTLDSISYQFNDSQLNNLASTNFNKSIFKKDKGFSNKNILNEINRLYLLYRNNGYLEFDRDNIFAEIDTFTNNKNDSLLVNKANISFLLSPLTNPKQIIKYTIRNQYFYSELNPIDLLDTQINVRNWKYVTNHNHLYSQSNLNHFRISVFEKQSLLEYGQLFNQQFFDRTLSNLSNLNCWTQINTKFNIDKDSVDILFLLTQSAKKSTLVDFEISNNTGPSLDPSTSNLLGVGTNFQYRNKNSFKRAFLFTTNFKVGSEININYHSTGFLKNQTFNTNIGTSIIIPRLLTPFNLKNKLSIETPRTSHNLNLAFINRFTYFNSYVLTYNFSYDWYKLGNKTNTYFSYKPINLELYTILEKENFSQLIASNPFLRASFNDGNVYGQNLTVIFSNIKGKPFIEQSLRFSLEESGFILNLFPNTDYIYKFIKLTTEYRFKKRLNKGEFGYRFISGIGKNYNNRFYSLPFFKQFTAGGVNSMRGWVVRQLGLGSSTLQDTISLNNYRDRFGDLQLETNLEYRFKMFNLGSIGFNSTVFVDIGNIWNLTDNPDDPKSIFKLSRLYRDLALNVGTGLRIDIASYFTLRLDIGVKIKDPTRSTNNGWADLTHFKLYEVKQNSQGSFKINNIAFQLGIGLPF